MSALRTVRGFSADGHHVAVVRDADDIIELRVTNAREVWSIRLGIDAAVALENAIRGAREEKA